MLHGSASETTASEFRLLLTRYTLHLFAAPYTCSLHPTPLRYTLHLPTHYTLHLFGV